MEAAPASEAQDVKTPPPSCSTVGCDDPARRKSGLCPRCYYRAYRAANRERLNAYHRAYAKASVERRREINRKWRNGNGRDRSRETVAEWKRRNREKVNAQNRRWTQAHPEVIAERNARRRALRNGAGDATLTNAEWLAICEAQDGRCFYCEVETKLTQDHKIPLTRGGPHTAENVVGACQPCNSRKRDRTTDEYLAATA